MRYREKLKKKKPIVIFVFKEVYKTLYRLIQ